MHKTPWFLRVLGYKPHRRVKYLVDQNCPHEPSKFDGYAYYR